MSHLKNLFYIIKTRFYNFITRSDVMAKNNIKDNFMVKPIEKHDTAAWSNHVKTKPLSNVIIPDEIDVRNAKEYVDTNEK